MKYFVITAFLFSQTAFSFGQKLNDDMSFFNYSYNKQIIKKNKVATVTIEMSFSKDSSSGRSVYYFNKEGLLTRQDIQDAKGNLDRTFYFKSNVHQDLIARIQNDVEFKRTDTVHYFKTYMGTKLLTDSAGDLPVICQYEYNQQGYLIKTIFQTRAGFGNNTKRVIINSLDSLNRIVHSVETVYQGDNDVTGTLSSDRDFLYDHEGKPEKEIEHVDGTYSWMSNKGSINYVYDSKANLVQIIRSNAASCTYTYNDKGLITSKMTNMKIGSDAIVSTETNMQTFDKYSYTFWP
jgi:hypothetical protein